MVSKATFSTSIINEARIRALSLKNSSFQPTAYAPINSQTNRINKSLEEATVFIKKQEKSWQWWMYTFTVLSVLLKGSLTQRMPSPVLVQRSSHTEGSSAAGTEIFCPPKQWCCWAQLQITHPYFTTGSCCNWIIPLSWIGKSALSSYLVLELWSSK